MMKKYCKRVIWIIVALLVLAGIVSAFIPKPISVDMAKAARAPMQVTIDAEGKARVHDRYTISAPVTGQLERIALQEGDPVERGATVAAIVPPPLDPRQREELESRISAAEANHRQAMALSEQVAVLYEQTERERLRLEEVESSGAVAHQDVERAANAARRTEKELASAKHRAQSAAWEVAAARSGREAYGGRRVVLRAPVSGRVLQILETSQRVLPAGTPIMQVGDPNGLEIVVDLLSSDAVNVEQGMSVMLDGWGGAAVTGRIRYVEPSAFTKISALGIEEQRVNVIVELTDPAARLGDGFRVDAHIIIWQGAKTLQVPTSALFRDDKGWSLFLVRDGMAHKQQVKIGHRNAFSAEITSGVVEGDRVILHPSDLIEEGTAVEERAK